MLIRNFPQTSAASQTDLVCFCHLRWDFVFQRPQHLMTRFGQRQRVFFIEESEFGEGPSRLTIREHGSGVRVVKPVLMEEDRGAEASIIRNLLSEFFEEHKIRSFVAWFYSPMFLEWATHLKPLGVIYDCMDELSAFKNAPPLMKEREQELLRRADLVFTGGYSLYEAKKKQHPNVYPFPSSIDTAHFVQARRIRTEPSDQKNIAGPRIGYAGVIDERLDIRLLEGVARNHPEWQFVLLGPIVKIDAAQLPRFNNIHYLGQKDYQELPAYLAGWDVAMLPFARNESTRFISPTKTPEYLAAGRAVVSTSIPDVLRTYGGLGVIHFGDEIHDFSAAVQEALSENSTERLKKVDSALSETSWAKTWGRMAELVDDVVCQRLEKPKAMHASASLAAASAAS